MTITALDTASKQDVDVLAQNQSLQVWVSSLMSGELQTMNRLAGGAIAPYTTIVKTTAATVAKNGAGIFYGLYIQSATTSIVTVLDGITTATTDAIWINAFPTTAGSGGLVANGNNGFIPAGPGGMGIQFVTGCTIVQTSAASIFPVVV